MQPFSVLLKKNFPRSLTLLYCHNSFSISFIWTKWTSQSLTTARSKERRRSCTFKRNVPSAVSFQCMTKSTTNKKKKEMLLFERKSGILLMREMERMDICWQPAVSVIYIIYCSQDFWRNGYLRDQSYILYQENAVQLCYIAK